MKSLEKSFIKALRRHGAEKVLNRLSLACRDEADRLRPHYFHLPSRRLLGEVTFTQSALIGAKDEIRRELKQSPDRRRA